MRKRFVATLLSGLLTAVCIFGFTACDLMNIVKGSDETPKDGQVTEEQWKAAFVAIIAANNYTIDMSMVLSTTQKYENYDGKEYVFTTLTTSSGRTYVNSDRAYSNSIAKIKTNGLQDLLGEDDYEIEAIEEAYFVLEGSVLWKCSFSAKKYAGDEGKEPEWLVEKLEHVSAKAAEEDFAAEVTTGKELFENNVYSTGKNTTESKKLTELYSAFTYSDGKYTATLYSEGEAVAVEISISDGYVTEYGASAVKQTTEDGVLTKAEVEAKCAFKNFGRITANGPAEAVEALNKAKAGK